MVSFAIQRSIRVWHLYASWRSISCTNCCCQVISIDLLARYLHHPNQILAMILETSTQKIYEKPQHLMLTSFVVIQSAKFMNRGTKFLQFFETIPRYFLFSFTYHGFRYLQISGAPNDVSTDDVECPFVHSETTLISDFKSSNPIINQIQHNILWGQLSNSMSLPTDW